MEFNEALSYINQGNCVLFVGSGFSIGATNSEGLCLPTGSGLAKLFYNECNESSDGGNLQDASDLYVERHGTTALVNRLKELFTINGPKDITSDQKFITSLPWKRVYTTNYDNIVEVGYSCSSKKIYPKVLSDSLLDINDKTKLCIHLNGYIGSLDESSIDKEFKLTDQSYTSEDFIESDWITLFDIDLKIADAIFFMGFSMGTDLDIKRIISRDPETYQKCYFVVGDKEKSPVVRMLNNYGQVLPINTSGFVERYKKITPKAIRLEEKLRCFDLIKNNTISPIEIKDKDIHNLLTLGTIDTNKIAASISFTNKEYYINRTVISDIVDKVEDGAKRILIHSDIANGKTMLLWGIAMHLSSKKYNVYFHNGNSYNIDNEIEKICKDSATNIVFIVDNYSNNRKIIDSIRLLGQNSIAYSKRKKYSQ